MLINAFLKKYNKLFYIIIFVNLSLFIGCEQEKEDESPIEPHYKNTAKIEGRVLGNGGYSTINETNINDAAVYLSEINKDGTVQRLSQSNVTSDQNGIFHTSIDYSGGK